MKNERIWIAKRIRHLRREKGLTQAQLAEHTRLSDNFIGYVERGIKTPSLESLERIAQALSVRLLELFKANGNGFKAKPQPKDEKGRLIQKVTNRLKAMKLRDVRIILQLVKLIALKKL